MKIKFTIRFWITILIMLLIVIICTILDYLELSFITKNLKEFMPIFIVLCGYFVIKDNEITKEITDKLIKGEISDIYKFMSSLEIYNKDMCDLVTISYNDYLEKAILKEKAYCKQISKNVIEYEHKKGVVKEFDCKKDVNKLNKHRLLKEDINKVVAKEITWNELYHRNLKNKVSFISAAYCANKLTNKELINSISKTHNEIVKNKALKIEVTI